MSIFDFLSRLQGGQTQPNPTAFPAGDGSGGFPTPDLNSLGNNVVVPSDFMGRPRLARGLDNALLSLATMQNSPIAGQNVGNVARNLIGLNSERASINLNRQLAPYSAMEPFLKQQSELNLQDAQAAEARGKAQYFEAGGRQMRPEPFIDGKGNAWQLTPSGPTPMMGPDGKQLTGHPTGSAGSELMQLLHGEEAESVANGGQPWTAVQRSNRWAQLAGIRTGDQTTGRINATPGFLSDAAKEGLKNDLSPIDAELGRLSKMNGVERIVENATTPGKTVDQRVSELTAQRNQILNKYIPQGAAMSQPQSGSTVDIPQPVVSPVMDQRTPTMIGNTPAVLGGGATPTDLANALVPPGPQAARPAKPAPVASKPSPAKSPRPRVTIDPKGNVSVE